MIHSAAASVSASPTFTGTITAAALTLSGTLTGVSANFSGRVAVGSGTSADTWLYMAGSTGLTGATQYGILSSIEFQSAATTGARAGEFQVRTAAAAFTMATGTGIRIANASVGAGSTITTLIGLDIANQTGGGTNYSIRTGTGLVSLGGAVSMASTLDVTGIITCGNTVSASVVNTVTNKIKLTIGGVDYYLLASTSGT